jgi:fumarylacetoacetase
VSWLPVAPDSDFSLANLPYGVVARDDGSVVAAVAVGDHVVDLAALQCAGLLGTQLPERVFERSVLNPFLGLGRAVWQSVRARLATLLGGDDPALAGDHALRDRAVLPRASVRPQLPVAVGDYVDFYSSLAHATNMGRILRPGTEPLPENWRRLPVGYHGRAGTILVSGTPVARPHGLRRDETGTVDAGPSRRLDFELEVGFVVGTGNPIGTRISARDAFDHIFGFVLVNDWSARDIQAFEYQPLGPFLGKSFATSISPWVVPVDALRPFLVRGPEQQPPVAPYLRCDEPSALDLELEVELRAAGGGPSTTVTRVNFASMYWRAPQQLAHATVNGAATRPGDLCASGTVSGDEPGSVGSLMEATWGGTRPIELRGGTTRTFLEDGDEVVMRGWCGGDGRARVGFGEVTGTVVAAPAL